MNYHGMFRQAAIKMLEEEKERNIFCLNYIRVEFCLIVFTGV